MGTVTVGNMFSDETSSQETRQEDQSEISDCLHVPKEIDQSTVDSILGINASVPHSNLTNTSECVSRPLNGSYPDLYDLCPAIVESRQATVPGFLHLPLSALCPSEHLTHAVEEPQQQLGTYQHDSQLAAHQEFCGDSYDIELYSLYHGTAAAGVYQNRQGGEM